MKFKVYFERYIYVDAADEDAAEMNAGEQHIEDWTDTELTVELVAFEDK